MPQSHLEIDAKGTALLIVDVQNFTLGIKTEPFPTSVIYENSLRLADACRKAGILVALVRVGHDGAGVPPLRPTTDAPFSGFSLSAQDKEIPSELAAKGDIVVDKYNWGAFYGTSLDTHLRRRAIHTLIVTGLVTNIGVDTTMRQAHERGYDQILVSDAVSAMTVAEHDYTIQVIAPRLSRVRTTMDVIAGLEKASL
ncbi:isochorismatase family protein [Sphingobium sp.]|uniref:isochorismatase family protein n=1 Tax=Sphingobium sp. TaxID=1912891 RepID=UPI0028BE5A60|nr:isochorismatase family protein [Sphingobium sp.]